MQVNMAQKASGIEDRRMKTSPFERGEDFISSDDRNKKPGAGPGWYHQGNAEIEYRGLPLPTVRAFTLIVKVRFKCALISDGSSISAVMRP